ncbi:MAG TPA: hypothetical protein VLG16_01535 [Candidatus Saccharimonadales bacterium]|nr:hypothetical protein [Candidatus Saccharimonadales bacterium]
MQTIVSKTARVPYGPVSRETGSDIIGRVFVDSGEMTSMVVGIYEDSYPEPSFHIEVQPRASVINTSLVRVHEAGEYKLTYHFQNFQDTPCKVTVRLCTTS